MLFNSLRSMAVEQHLVVLRVLGCVSPCRRVLCVLGRGPLQGMVTPMPRLHHVYTTTVGAKRSCARYYLNSVVDVHAVLAQLAGAVDDDSPAAAATSDSPVPSM